ncbi:GntR family transcriptional regulator [Roseomonas sp. BN140053]|uniref:GntR family transcriptional regulator n=1 Tax=Roseomonas sp. BN140053 TaxID=3391898 RepID=UPI0039ECCEDA
MTEASPSAPPRPDARPLYAQVEAILTGRIVGGDWPPGHALPAEPELAQELGVSHGTVRKALAALEARRLIERRQGKGTFVAQHTSEQARDHFFRVRDLEGREANPTSLVLSLHTDAATPAEAAAFALPAEAAVHRLRRLRLQDGQPFLVEEITLPAAIFPGFTLALGRELPDELYVLYQRRHGVTVVRTRESLSALPAGAAEADLLGVPPGTALLAVERRTWDAAGRVVEQRLSQLNTARFRYVMELD